MCMLGDWWRGGAWSFEVPGGVLCCCLFDFPVIFNTVPHCRPNSLPCYKGFFQALQWPVCSKVILKKWTGVRAQSLHFSVLRFFCRETPLLTILSLTKRLYCWDFWSLKCCSYILKDSHLIFTEGIIDQLLIIIGRHSMICNRLAVSKKSDHKCQSEPKPESLIY